MSDASGSADSSTYMLRLVSKFLYIAMRPGGWVFHWLELWKRQHRRAAQWRLPRVQLRAPRRVGLGRRERDHVGAHAPPWSGGALAPPSRGAVPPLPIYSNCMGGTRGRAPGGRARASGTGLRLRGWLQTLDSRMVLMDWVEG